MLLAIYTKMHPVSYLSYSDRSCTLSDSCVKISKKYEVFPNFQTAEVNEKIIGIGTILETTYDFL